MKTKWFILFLCHKYNYGEEPMTEVWSMLPTRTLYANLEAAQADVGLSIGTLTLQGWTVKNHNIFSVDDSQVEYAGKVTL